MLVSFSRAYLVAVVAASVLAATPCMSRARSADDAFDRLPQVEVPGRQIGWPQSGTLDAFTRAVEEAKPMIVVFGSAESSFTQQLAELVMPCPQLNQLAGAAVFVYGSPLADEFARRMAVQLKLTVYPTISVFAPRTDRLTELHRLEGFFDAETIASDLRQVIERGGYWPKGLAAPTSLPRHVLAYPGKACTREGAERLGIRTK